MQKRKNNIYFLGIAFIAIFFICILPQNGLSATGTSINTGAQSYNQYLVDRWQYYKTISLSSPTKTSNDEVKVILNTTNFDYNLAKSDGSDIRFDDFNGHFYNFWIQNWNTTGQSIIWVKITKIGTQSFRMIYGRSDISTASDGKTAFLMYDDFLGYTYNSDIWYSYTSPYSGINVANGVADIISIPQNATDGIAEIGFSDRTFNQSVSNQSYWVNGHAALTLTKNLNWSIVEIDWINSTLSNIYIDGAYIGSDNSLKNGTLPIEIYASAKDSVNNTMSRVYLRSILSNLGESGRMFIASLSVNMDDGVDISVDWAAIGVLPSNNIDITIGPRMDLQTVAGFNPITMGFAIFISMAILVTLVIRNKKFHIKKN